MDNVEKPLNLQGRFSVVLIWGKNMQNLSRVEAGSIENMVNWDWKYKKG